MTMPTLSTAQSAFLCPSSIKGHPPNHVILRGVNLSSTAKFPTYTPSSSSPHLDSREGRDQEREYKLGARSDLSPEEYDLYGEGEAGGHDGWFVGRPILLEEADVHFLRLRSWGFNVIRWIVPWEALEHGGPGKYDEPYIDYTISLLRKAREYGLRVFISPHQDSFSRYFSGSGAPYWAIQACGIEPRRVHQTGSAVVHHEWKRQGWGGTEGKESAKAGDVEDWPDMIWNTNLSRLASRHCFTMFFASHVFAPNCKIDGKPVSRYLQDHWMAAYAHLAERIAEAGRLLDSCVIGWDSMNEPHEGFIEIPDLNEIPPSQGFKKGPCPTPLQAFQLATGKPVSNVAVYDFGSFGASKKGSITITPQDGKGVWLSPQEASEAAERWGWEWSGWNWAQDGVGCPWAAHGVWDAAEGRILKKDYFSRKGDGGEWDFIDDFWKPHYLEYMAAIRKHHPTAISFINPPIFQMPPNLTSPQTKGRLALSAHFYDGLTMLGKRRMRFNAHAVGIQRGTKGILGAIKVGDNSIRNGMRQQLGELKSDASNTESVADDHRSYPTIIGEIGVPFDMKQSHLWGFAKGKEDREDYTEPAKAMDQILNGCDGENALSYTLWCYEPFNSHEHGDGWQGEDLSLFSYSDTAGDDDLIAEQPLDLRSLMTIGARAIESWCRPYPVCTAGQVKFFQFDIASTKFELRIFLPPIEELYDTPPSVTQLEQASQSEAMTEIFLPYVHYVDPSYDDLNRQREEKAKGEIIGKEKEGEMEWIKGRGKARLAVRVDMMTEGRLELEGQNARWFYPLVPEPVSENSDATGQTSGSGTVSGSDTGPNACTGEGREIRLILRSCRRSGSS